MIYSNLSKIRPKLRTEGNITGNFGRSKVKAGSTMNEIGMTTRKIGRLATQDEYLNRMFHAYETTTDPKIKRFAYNEIRKIMIQRGQW
jgi:hypothetical protein